MVLPRLKGNAYVPFTCNLAIIMVLLQFALIVVLSHICYLNGIFLLCDIGYTLPLYKLQPYANIYKCMHLANDCMYIYTVYMTP